MADAAYLVTLGESTTSHRTFTRAALHLASTLGDADTVERGIQIVEFSEDDGIVLTQSWTPRMIDGEIAWTTASHPW